MPSSLRALMTIGWYAAVFGAAFVVAMVASALGTIDNAHLLVLTKLAALFATLGALYGAIIALDLSAPRVLAPWNWIQQVEAPAARTVVCAALGTTAAWVVWSFSPLSFGLAWVAVGTSLGAALGWYGWRWAKHIDF
jgi:hypothetical protein